MELHWKSQFGTKKLHYWNIFYCENIPFSIKLIQFLSKLVCLSLSISSSLITLNIGIESLPLRWNSKEGVNLLMDGHKMRHCILDISCHFGRLSFGRLSFGRLSFGRLSFGRLSFGRLSFGRLWLGRLSLWTNCHEVDYHLADCHLADYHLADCHLADCHLADCHLADCHWADCHLADSHSADSHLVDCHLSILVQMFVT